LINILKVRNAGASTYNKLLLLLKVFVLYIIRLAPLKKACSVSLILLKVSFREACFCVKVAAEVKPNLFMAKEKKNRAVKIPKSVQPKPETMRKLWANFFELYAEEIKPYQDAQALTAHRGGYR
jgi:hypothetical protein